MELEQTGERARPEDTPRTPASARCTMRAIRDGDHGFVLVYQPEAKTGARELVFESDGSCVRVSQFPENWRQLAEDDLLALRRGLP